MQPQDTGVQYRRWNNNSRDEVSVNVSTAEASGCRRVYNKLCTGKVGIAVKVIGGNILFWIVFIIGYVTGYYVHKCK
ncbi:PREDICTED: small integral membrane protein 1 [Gavialis gangeticus]|uniref:Small integral membrane protein 1 n=1 Tax=Alligator sinensis TaxID=38654 RepID=A0A1U7RDX7_ALLSI|nr:small integral membrane protein 1 [Alligator sinensis]XP_019367178.1 PREDICTED: small integral membrane protein 1 [Gavialis gangeticus]XP_019367179.1 PREDICTED: small integral membrane protein 1 [Gavialis gangeticus]XP_025067977.1 small integral membrane protein 1 [Alligator sinensis]